MIIKLIFLKNEDRVFSASLLFDFKQSEAMAERD